MITPDFLKKYTFKNKAFCNKKHLTDFKNLSGVSKKKPLITERLYGIMPDLLVRNLME